MPKVWCFAHLVQQGTCIHLHSSIVAPCKDTMVLYAAIAAVHDMHQIHVTCQIIAAWLDVTAVTAAAWVRI